MSVGGHNLKSIRYADSTVFIADIEMEVQGLLHKLKKIGKERERK